MSLPNDTTNDSTYCHYTKNNSVTSRSMIASNSPSSVRLNEAQAISLIYLQVVATEKGNREKL